MPDEQQMMSEESSAPQPERTGRGAALLAIVFLVVVFFLFSRPVDDISDFWWHLTSGRWMASNSGLPDEDPFSYTTAEGLSQRKALILKGTWLSDMAYYAIHSAFGMEGIVWAKAAIFTLMIIALWRMLAAAGASLAGSMLLIALTLVPLSHYDDMRPLILTLFFFTAFLLIVGGMINSLRQGQKPTALAVSLFLLSALWANLHPGFVMIYPLALAYASGETYARMKEGRGLDADAYRRFMLVLAACVLASRLNPNGFSAASALISVFRDPRTGEWIEYLPFWRASAETGPYFFWSWALIAILSTYAVLRGWKRLDITHRILFVMLLLLSALAMRLSAFFILYAPYALVMAMGSEMPISSAAREVKTALLSVAVAAVGIFALTGSILFMPAIRETVTSDNAIRFVAANRLPAPLFNSYEWGGIVMARLWPSYQVFSDSRVLDHDAFDDQALALNGQELEMLEKHAVNTVLVNHANPLHRTVNLMVFTLLESPSWRLVYHDKMSVIFVREELAGSLPSTDKLTFYRSMIGWLNEWRHEDPSDPLPLIMLGQVHLVMAGPEAAITHFREALAVAPESFEARQWVETVEGMLGQKPAPSEGSGRKLRY